MTSNRTEGRGCLPGRRVLVRRMRRTADLISGNYGAALEPASPAEGCSESEGRNEMVVRNRVLCRATYSSYYPVWEQCRVQRRCNATRFAAACLSRIPRLPNMATPLFPKRHLLTIPSTPRTRAGVNSRRPVPHALHPCLFPLGSLVASPRSRATERRRTPAVTHLQALPAGEHLPVN